MGTTNFDLPNKNVALIGGVYGNPTSTYYQLAVGDKIYFSFTGHTATIQLFGGTWDITVDGSLSSGVSVGESFSQIALLTAGTDGPHTVICAPKTIGGTGIDAIHRTTAIVVTSAGTPSLSPYTGFGPYYRYLDYPTLFRLESGWVASNDRNAQSNDAAFNAAVRVKGTATGVQVNIFRDASKYHLQADGAAPLTTVTAANSSDFGLVSLGTGIDNGSEKTWTIRCVLEGGFGAFFFAGVMFIGGDIGAAAPAARDLDVIYGDSIAYLLHSTDRSDEGLVGEAIANGHGVDLAGVSGSTVVGSGQTDGRVTAVLALNPANVVVLYGQNDSNDGTFQTAFAAMIQKFYDGVGAQAGLRTATGAKKFIILGCLREIDDATIAGKNAKIQAALALVTVPGGAPVWQYVATTSASWPQSSTAGDFLDGIHPDRAGRLKEAAALTPLLSDAPTAPTAPILGVDNVEVAEGSIRVSTQPPSSNGGSAIIAYEIWRNRASAGYALRTTILAANIGTPYDDTGTVVGETVSYKVKCYNAIGYSAFSAEQTVTSQGPHTAIARPGRGKPLAGHIQHLQHIQHLG